MSASRNRRLVAMALVSAAVLVYEVAITRVLSVALWYHFAFLSVSLAMLAIGAPGVWFALRPPGGRTVPAALLGAAVAMPASIVAIVQGGRHFARFGRESPIGEALLGNGVLVVAACAFVPLLLAGSAVCALLVEQPGRSVGRMYAADLLGATVGAAAVVPLMWVLPTPHLVAAAGLLPLLAAVLVGANRLASGAIAVATLAVLIWGDPVRLTWTKKYDEGADPATTPLWEKWTPTARITVFPTVFFEKGGEAGFGWGMGDAWVRQPGRQLWIEQDGAAGTPIVRYSGDPADTAHLAFDVTGVVYQLAAPARVCVIGAGGGRDVLTALAAGATDVDAVELNAAMVEAVSERFADWSGDVYHLPGVHAHVSEGRSFLTRSRGGYDVLQISLIDSWAATAAGAYALSESFLYTTEAFQLYLDRLAPDGVVSISRWIGGRHGLESTRLALLARQALAERGVARPEDHLAVVAAGGVATLLASPTPFGAARIARIDEIAAHRGFHRLWPRKPGARDLVGQVLADGPGEVVQAGFDMSAPTDNRPFFFHTVPLFGAPADERLAEFSVNEGAGAVLRRLIVGVALCTSLLIFAPFALAGRLPRGPGFWRGSAFFVAIGISFMLIEVSWMQRIILFLGHPSYATTVVLATLLLGASLGAAASARVGAGREAGVAGLAIPGVVALLNAVLPAVLEGAIGAPLAARVVITIVLLLPAGVVMGFPFPWGMARLGDKHRAWFWAVNGAAGVLASVSSVGIAMMAGFSTVGWIGVGGYLVAWLLLRDTGRFGATRVDAN